MAMSSPGSASGRGSGQADAVLLGALIRDLRLANGWSQGRLVAALEASFRRPAGPRVRVEVGAREAERRAGSGCGIWPRCCRFR